MRRILLVTTFVVLSFVGGMLTYELRNADASGVGGASSCQTGSGNRVCGTSPTLTTPNIGVASGTSLTLTQGISAVSGLFSGNVGITGTCAVTGATTLAGGLTEVGAWGLSGTGSITGAVSHTGAAGSPALSIVGIGTGVAALKVTPATTVANSDGIQVLNGNITTTVTRYGVNATIGNTIGGAAIYGSATAANGDGVLAQNNGGGAGYAIRMVSDATSPANGALAWTIQDANPTGAIVGATFMYTGGIIRVATATTPLWQDVAGLLSTTTGLTAFAGGGQASATAVCASAGVFVVGTVATAGDSVKLPATPDVGQLCEIVNADGTDAMDLFPGSGDTLCVSGSGCLASDAATSITATIRMRRCRAQSASVWNCQ